MFDYLPIFGICGFSGSGKTTLIEKLIPRLSANGLKVLVVKHANREINVDKSGKDSDRFFRSGADVILQGPGEEFSRIHPSDNSELSFTLISLSRKYDIVLVEGQKNTPFTKVWLLSENEINPPVDIEGISAILPKDTDRAGKVMAILDDWLPMQLMKTPVFTCLLIGGGNNRMGAPKHLIVDNGKTWIKKTTEILKHVSKRVVIVGAGSVPDELTDIVHLPDIADIPGPMGGILSAMRWAPYVSWLVSACDMPDMTQEALEWLLSTRRPGVWATLPRLGESGRIEPLLAHYDFRSHILLERLAVRGEFRPRKIAASRKVITEIPPGNLTTAWININTKAELKSYKNL